MEIENFKEFDAINAESLETFKFIVESLFGKMKTKTMHKYDNVYVTTNICGYKYFNNNDMKHEK